VSASSKWDYLGFESLDHGKLAKAPIAASSAIQTAKENWRSAENIGSRSKEKTVETSVFWLVSWNHLLPYTITATGGLR
jgi:hypothetical protein